MVVWRKPAAAFSCLLVILFMGFGASAETLTLAFHPHPGLAELVDGKPTGTYLTVAVKVAEMAGLTINWMDLPQRRLLYYVQERKPNFCAVGLYKDDDRAAYAKFSDPYYRDQRYMVVAARSSAEKVRDHKSFLELTKDLKLKAAAVDGRAYGEYIDDIFMEMSENIEWQVIDVQSVYSMTAAGRIDYFVGAPEEYNSIVNILGLTQNDLAIVDFPDLPDGNLRYFMCSKAVDDATIAKINAAIQALHLGKL